VIGVALSIRRGIESLPMPRCTTLDVVGGGGRHPEFLQLLADVTGRPVHRVAIENPTAVGAARLGWTVAEGEPCPALRVMEAELEPRQDSPVRERYADFLQATDALGQAGDRV
jgi:sugar (pentulose or hexulose) kinase